MTQQHRHTLANRKRCTIPVVSYNLHDTVYVTCKGVSTAVVSGLAYDKITDNANTMLASNHGTHWCMRDLKCLTTNLVLFITKVCHAFCFVNPRIPNDSIREIGLLNRNNFAAFLVHNLQRCTYFTTSGAQIPALSANTCCWLISTMLHICCTLGQHEAYSSSRSGQGQNSDPVASATAGLVVLQKQHRQAASKLAQQQFEMNHAWSACRVMFCACTSSYTC